MKITLVKKSEVKYVQDIWNQYTAQDNVYYCSVSLEDAFAKFFDETSTYQILTYVVKIDGSIVGFSSGTIVKGTKRAYVSAVIVDKLHSKKGYGKSLLDTLMKGLIEKSEVPLLSIDYVFYNPVSLEWKIPNELQVFHPGAPGVLTESLGHKFLHEKGFHTFAEQYTYYQDIRNYTLSNPIKDRICKLKDQGIEVCLYNEEIHRGFDQLFEDLNSIAWKKIVDNNSNKEFPLPILVVVKDNTIYGFSGPLFKQENNRGYFPGIGVHSSLRGIGVGRVLFAMLCQSLKDIGAEYMTFFTGSNNVARKIYEQEGFNVVAKWADMRYIIKNEESNENI